MQWNFTFSGSKYNLFLEPGRYLLECWGAQGAGSDVSPLPEMGAGGRGGYSFGTIFLQEKTNIFVYVGGTGKVIDSGFAEGGFNGGGSAWGTTTSTDPAGGGGGGTDIRLNSEDLYSRVIVAGGGGGGGEDGGPGGFGGGLEGGTNPTNFESYPGTQTSASHGATFGHGAHTSYNGGGGGGGWYGGGVRLGQETPATSGTIYDTKGGSGGSGYVYTKETFHNYPEGCKLNKFYFLEDAKTIGGNESIIEPNGTSSIGHFGDGYVRITLLAFKYQNIFYRNHSESTLSVLLKDQECNSSIYIPSYIDDKAVISILPGAFYRNTCLREVKIPKTFFQML